MKRLFLFILTFSLTIIPLTASVQLVKGGKASSRICIGQNSNERQAANLLQTFIERMSGTKLPIVAYKNNDFKNKDIVILHREDSLIQEDGYKIIVDDQNVSIIYNKGKGAIYGAVSLLESLGVDYYGENEFYAPHKDDIMLPTQCKIENPAFRYRQSQSYALNDSIYRMWMRLEEPQDEFVDRLWVHTFNKLLPSEIYGASHPEYYSYINGQRRPGAASQWCLTNDEVFEIVANKIDSIFDANPEFNMISVSQNDGNNTFCTCEKCKEIIEKEGAVSGLFINFLNRLAERRPDKQFSTLAYLFTMMPPKHIKPLSNVNIMLCDIDTKREVPLTDNESGRYFMKALEGWSKISNNLFVWDYGINFDCYLAPFPNFPILQKNMQIFRDNNVKMHFSQISSSKGGDFAEMRTYMVSKLMWNPELNADSLMRSFMKGYYGDAAPYLYQYEKILEGGLLASNLPLWIYDSPVTHKDGMLNANSRKRLNELLDAAEVAVIRDQERLDRVKRQRLSLQFSELEIMRSEGIVNPENALDLLQTFENNVKKFNVPTINERNNSPVDYCTLYRQRYMVDLSSNKAKGAKVKWITPPTGKYENLGNTALTDGIYGGAGFVESWVGWEGQDASFILDLQNTIEFNRVAGDFLHQLGAWVFLPKCMTVEYSKDGENWNMMGKSEEMEDRDVQVKFKKVEILSDSPIIARYVKFNIEGVKTCPGWHYGVGQPGWFFIDEIEID